MLAAILMSAMTWSPFQSPQVKEICSHLGPGEYTALTLRSAVYGAWVALTLGIPFGFIVAFWSHGAPAVRSICFVLIGLHIACVPIWQRAQKRFLCSTQWGRLNGLRPDSLELFSFRRRRT